MFDRCCNSKNVVDYKITHNPKPIPLPNDMDAIVKNLLWYAPNIDSYQAPKNELIQDKVYDDFSFTYIMNKMGMVEDNDVKWLEQNENVADDDWAYYENEICVNCQKFIITRVKSQSKTNNLLRCVRNCIAHGQFTVVGDYMIGFNSQHTNKGADKKKAVIKFKPRLLLDAIKSLTSPIAKEALVGYAFERIGYTIEPLSTSSMFDIALEKNGKRFEVEIKTFQGKPYVHPDHLRRFLDSNKGMPNVTRVLFIDTSKVTKEVRKLEKGLENFIIIDLLQVRDLLSEQPVDPLAEF